MIITINEPLPSLNRLQNLHWALRKQLKDKWDILIRLEANPYEVRKGSKYHVIITRYGIKYLDYDNLVGGGKFVIDILKFVRYKVIGNKRIRLDEPAYIYDDDPNHLTAEYRQVKSKKSKITIEIEEE